MPFKNGRREQIYLLPRSVDEWIGPMHPARFVWAFVLSLDLAALGFGVRAAVRGASAYPPRELLAVWLYGFMDGRRSSRSLERACQETLPYIWLMGTLQPDHVTLWRFYRDNQQAMRLLFKETVRAALDEGLIDFAVQAIDGSKIPIGSASSLREKSKLEKLLTALDREIAKMEAQEIEAEESDDEDASDGDGRRLAKIKARRERVHVALQSIKAEEAETPPADKQVPATKTKKKEPTACPTDPEASLLKTRHGWKMGYNAQVLVDAKCQIIVAADVTDQCYDHHQLIPLLEQERETLGRYGAVTLADNGYFSAANVAYAQERTDLHVPDKIHEKAQRDGPDPYHRSNFTYDAQKDAYICPEGQELPFVRRSVASNGRVRRQYQCTTCSNCSNRDACTTSSRGRTINRTAEMDVLAAHREKMMTEEAKALMKQRPPLVEAVFGILKECNSARRFLRHGLEKVKSEWDLLCAAFNLKKMYQARCEAVALMAAA